MPTPNTYLGSFIHINHFLQFTVSYQNVLWVTMSVFALEKKILMVTLGAFVFRAKFGFKGKIGNLIFANKKYLNLRQENVGFPKDG